MFIEKRPALLALVFAVIAALIAYCCNFTVMCVTAVLFLAAAVFAAVIYKPTVLVSAIIGLAVLVQAVAIQFYTLDKLKAFDTENVEICGTLCSSFSAGEEYVTQNVMVSSIDGISFITPVKVRLVNSNGFVAEQGDNICVTARLKISENTAYETSNYAQGIYATGNNIKVKYVTDGNNIYSLSGKVKAFVNEKLGHYLPYNEAAVLSAVVVGDRINIDDALYSNVIDSGVSHMLVVSGMHLSIICSAIIRLLHKFLSKRMSAVIVLPLVLFVAVVCDFGYSIMRAAISYIIFLVGSMLLKRSDPLSSLCMASIIILIYNPFALTSVSLLLSVASTAGIITVSVPMAERIEEKLCTRRGLSWLKIINEPLCMTVGAMVFCLPLSMLFFGRISVVSVLTNILVSFSITVALCAAVTGLLLCLIMPFEPLLNIVFAIAGICIKYFCTIVCAMANFSFASVSVTTVYAVVCTVLLLAAVTISFVLIRRGKTKKLVCIFAAAIIPFTAISVYLNVSKITVTAVKLKASQSVIISYKNTAVVIGAGNNTADGERISNTLKELNVRELDAVYIIDKEESFSGISTLLQSNTSRLVYTAQEAQTVAKIKEQCDNVFSLPESQSLPCGIKITFSDEAAYADLGGYSLFISTAEQLKPIQKLYAQKADAYIYTENGETCVNTYKTDVDNITLKIKQGYALISK